LCVADLVKVARSFHAHGNDSNEHNGFDRKELTEILFNTNFNVSYYSGCYEIEREVDKLLKVSTVFIICEKTPN
jgi:hypothetical protein